MTTTKNQEQLLSEALAISEALAEKLKVLAKTTPGLHRIVETTIATTCRLEDILEAKGFIE